MDKDGNIGLREIKKRCRQAVRSLVRHYGFKRNDFTPSDGTETLVAPSNLKPRFRETGHYFTPLKGTLLFARTVGYYEPEYEVDLPTDTLAEIELYERFDWAAEARKCFTPDPTPSTQGQPEGSPSVSGLVL